MSEPNVTTRTAQTLAGYIGLVYQEDPHPGDPRNRLRGPTLVAACRHSHKTPGAAEKCAAGMKRAALKQLDEVDG